MQYDKVEILGLAFLGRGLWIGIFDSVRLVDEYFSGLFSICFYWRMIWRILFLLQEFCHTQLCSNTSSLPRIFGMTASPIRLKVSTTWCFLYLVLSILQYADWSTISDLLIIFSTSRLNINMVLLEKYQWSRDSYELKGASLFSSLIFLHLYLFGITMI